MSKARHFLCLGDLGRERLGSLLRVARALRKLEHGALLHGRVLGLLFEQPSTRTRLSFEAAMLQLGGGAVFMSQSDSQLGRNESIADTARIMSRMVDAIAHRTPSHRRLLECAGHSEVPVINALSDEGHPCQILADLLTLAEHHGDLGAVTIAWCGDLNNVCLSYIEAASIFGFTLKVATPPELAGRIPDAHAGAVKVFSEAADAVRGANLVVTDVWTSMADESGPGAAERRSAMFAPYQVNSALLDLAADDARFTHCLPAHRGEEVSAEALDGERSIAWDAAENRLHAQKALLLYLLNQEAFADALSSQQ